MAEIDDDDDDVILEEEEKKPGLFFEDEFSIITDDSEIPVEEPEDGEEETPEVSIEDQIAQAVREATNTKDAEMIKTLQGIQEAVKPKREAPKPINMDEEIKKISTQLTEDPELAVKNLNKLITGQVAQAFQVQQGQILEGQKVTSKMLAQNDPNLKVVFDNWGEEVEQEVAKIILKPGQSANDVYREAGNKVMLNHMGDVITMKAQELLTQKPSAKPAKTGIKESHEAPVQEGKPKTSYIKIDPKATMANGQNALAWYNRQPNKTRAKNYLVTQGIAKQVK